MSFNWLKISNHNTYHIKWNNNANYDYDCDNNHWRYNSNRLLATKAFLEINIISLINYANMRSFSHLCICNFQFEWLQSDIERLSEWSEHRKLSSTCKMFVYLTIRSTFVDAIFILSLPITTDYEIAIWFFYELSFSWTEKNIRFILQTQKFIQFPEQKAKSTARLWLVTGNLWSFY